MLQRRRDVPRGPSKDSPQSLMFLGNTQNNERVIQTRMDTDPPRMDTDNVPARDCLIFFPIADFVRFNPYRSVVIRVHPWLSSRSFQSRERRENQDLDTNHDEISRCWTLAVHESQCSVQRLRACAGDAARGGASRKTDATIATSKPRPTAFQASIRPAPKKPEIASFQRSHTRSETQASCRSASKRDFTRRGARCPRRHRAKVGR